MSRLVSAGSSSAEPKAPSADDSKVNADGTGQEPLHRRIREDRTEEAIAEGLDLIREGPASGRKRDQLDWKKLWTALWKVRPSDELRQIAIEWLEEPAATDTRGRSSVWEILWKAERSPVMYTIGCDYLESAPPGRLKWAPIWQELWRYKQSPSLHSLAVRWLQTPFGSSAGKAQSPWPRVWLRAYEANPTPELAAVGRKWLQEYPDHRTAPHVRRLLEEHPL